MRRMAATGFVVAVLAVAAALGWTLPSRLVQYVDANFRQGRLYDLNAEERFRLNLLLDEAKRMAAIDKPIAINEPYRRNRVNVYIVRTGLDPHGAIAQGNAAFSSRDDILLIDSSYFQVGNERVLMDSPSESTQALLSTWRVYTYFVLLHELGHRAYQNTLPWWHIANSALHADPAQETAADEFAIKTLLQLYELDQKQAARSVRVMPAPVSTFIDMSGEPVGPGCRLVDHLGTAFALLSEEVLDHAFPLLSAGPTHPAFLKRMVSILGQLGDLSDVRANSDARRSLSLNKAIVSSAQNLMDLHPTEISFDSPVEYVLLDGESLYYFEFGVDAPTQVSVAQLKPNASLYVHNQERPVKRAQIQYAWMNSDGTFTAYRRDGTLTVFRRNGEMVAQVSLAGKLGDRSCVNEMLVPAMPTRYAYILSCEKGALEARLFENGSLRSIVPLQHLGPKERASDGANVVQITIGYRGDVGLYLRDGKDTELIESNQDLSQRSTRRVSDAPDPFQDTFKGKRVPFKSYLYAPAARASSGAVSGAAGRTYYFEGAALFKNLSLMRLDDGGSVTVGHYALSEGLDMERLHQVLPIREYRFISDSEVIVNLDETGTFLVNIDTGKIVPVSHQYFSRREQLIANTKGSWLLYRKYGTRVLYIPSGGEPR